MDDDMFDLLSKKEDPHDLQALLKRKISLWFSSARLDMSFRPLS